MYKKNQLNIFMPQWLFTQGVTDNVTSRIVIKTPDTSGTVTSPTFGPAKKWNQLHWRGSSLESPSADTAYVQLIGIDTAGKHTPLFNVGINNPDYDILSHTAKHNPLLQLEKSPPDTHTPYPHSSQHPRT